jgi:hypothetical protein
MPETIFHNCLSGSNMSEIYAELSVCGEPLEPTAVTETLGLEPSTTWRRGDLKGRRTDATYDYGCWRFCTVQNRLSLEEHVAVLMEVFSDRVDLIRSLCDEEGFEIEVGAVVYQRGESPDISLSKQAINWISSIGASLDIDTYLF